jgi:cytochrome P450
MNFINRGYLFLLQGHDTTSSALSWAIQLLGDHTDVQVTLPIAVLIRLNGYSVL